MGRPEGCLPCRGFRLPGQKKQPQYLHFNCHTDELQSIMGNIMLQKSYRYQAMFSGKSEISDTDGKKCNIIFSSRLSNALIQCTIIESLRDPRQQRQRERR